MASAALAYAYEKGDVDGVVTDIEEALKISGTKLSSGGEQRGRHHVCIGGQEKFTRTY